MEFTLYSSGCDGHVCIHASMQKLVVCMGQCQYRQFGGELAVYTHVYTNYSKSKMPVLVHTSDLT